MSADVLMIFPACLCQEVVDISGQMSQSVTLVVECKTVNCLEELQSGHIFYLIVVRSF